jgi:hypothetical protein
MIKILYVFPKNVIFKIIFKIKYIYNNLKE